jgi:replicative DNA helicase
LGISTVDRLIDGLEPGDLVIVAARPGIGKSAFVGNVAAHCGFHGVPSLFMSVEMMANKLGRRWLASEAKIDSHKFKRGDVDVEEWKRITAAASRFDGSLLWVNDRAATLGQVAGEVRRWHGRHVAPRFAKSGKVDDKRALAVVDYAQRIQIGREKGDTREQEVSKVPTGLKNLAKQLGIPVLLVAQLSRGYEQRGGDPQLSDLRETGAFEQEADIVIFLVHDKDGGHRAIVAKNREGGTGNAKCLWEPEVTTWKALADDAPEPAPHWSDNDR